MNSVIGCLIKSLRSSAIFNPDVQVAPAYILWSDVDRQWEPVIPLLQVAVFPELMILFIWNIWDGLRDVFATLVNFHKFDYKNLETLIYTHLDDWIMRQTKDKDKGNGVRPLWLPPTSAKVAPAFSATNRTLPGPNTVAKTLNLRPGITYLKVIAPMIIILNY